MKQKITQPKKEQTIQFFTESEVDRVHERLTNIGHNNAVLGMQLERMRQGASAAYWIACSTFILLVVLLLSFTLRF